MAYLNSITTTAHCTYRYCQVSERSSACIANLALVLPASRIPILLTPRCLGHVMATLRDTNFGTLMFRLLPFLTYRQLR